MSSAAEDLLNTLDVNDISLLSVTTATKTTASEEGHIVIGEDRYITVPEELKRIAVQYDHNVETVTFDCPRYWDELDMSQMRVYINYMRADGYKDTYLADRVTVDETDSNIMHFDWTISRNVTLVKGSLDFLVCIKKTDADGIEINHWNSDLCSDMRVSEGMECEEVIQNTYSDIINQLLERQDAVEAIATPEAMQNYADAWLTAHKEELLETKDYVLLRDASTGIVYSLAMIDGKLTATATETEN